MIPLPNLIRMAQAGEECVSLTRQIIGVACRGKVSVEFPPAPDLRGLSDEALETIALSTPDGEAEFNAVKDRPYPPSDPALFVETSGLRYWRAVCRRHAACCELLSRMRK